MLAIMTKPFSDKQLEFILKSTKHWNLAHGSVRSGKTVCTLSRFMEAAWNCPDSQIFMIGHTSETIYQNAVRLLMESPQLAMWRPYCSWFSGKRQLKFRDKTIQTLGAKDEGAIGQIQGKTMSLAYCDEMTLYPESITDMIDTRLSNSYSMGFASMNPAHPTHKLKQWIDKAENGDPNYYSLHFTLDDNPYVSEDYKQRIRNSLSGLFYKRNYLGLWCLAEGAIFDFFDTKIHVVDRHPAAAEYWIAGIDYGSVNPFACLLIGVSTGKYTQTGKRMWVQEEYYWDPKKEGKQKTNSEFAEDIAEFLEPYAIKNVYIDPSAAAMKLDLRKKGIHTVDANNDVEFGISLTTSEMKKGNLYIMRNCKNTIREIESFVWDNKKAERGEDAPIKKNDHTCVIGSTLVYTSDGEKTIESLVGNAENLYSYSIHSDIFELDEFYNVFKTRDDAEIWEIELESGKKLQATPDHQLLTQMGWKQIQELKEGEEIYTMNINYTMEESSIAKNQDIGMPLQNLK